MSLESTPKQCQEDKLFSSLSTLASVEEACTFDLRQILMGRRFVRAGGRQPMLFFYWSSVFLLEDVVMIKFAKNKHDQKVFCTLYQAVERI